MIYFVLESQGQVRENEFCRVVRTMYMQSAHWFQRDLGFYVRKMSTV